MIGLINSWPGYHSEAEQRHQDIQERHVDNVGERLIQPEEFRKWCGSSGEARMITRFYFVLVIRGPERHLSGNKDYSPVGEEREPR